VDHVIELADRELFKRCRRAWDLASPVRRNLEPVPAPGPGLTGALRAALAAYYYPAMWAWNRQLVCPIARQTFSKALGAAPAAADLAAGAAILDAYFAWAPGVDHFTAVRASEEFRIVVTDPSRPGEGLTAPDGGAVHLHGTVELVVSDEHSRLWVVEHRLLDGDAGWTDPEVLALDDRAGTLCWALEDFSVARVSGVIFNEVRLGAEPAFRRTAVRTPPRQLRQLRRQAAAEFLAMLDPGVACYPTPSPANCGPCPFRAPCLAISAGDDPEPLLAAGYRRRVPAAIPLPERTGSLGPQRVLGWKTRGPGASSLDAIRKA
jgi:hypothetical protein